MDSDRLLAAVQAWKEIDLPQVQLGLDAQGLEIVQNQKDGVVTRKKLAEQTKEFKKIPDDEKLKEFKNLLKAYQNEIDTLTKRTKVAEVAFLNLYKVLAEAPNPAAFGDVIIESFKELGTVADLKDENKKLKEDLARSQEQLAAHQKDGESKATLQARLTKYEAMLDEMVVEKVSQKETELKQVMDEKIRIYKETEYSLQKQVNQLMDQVASLRSTREDVEKRLVDHGQMYDEQVAAKLGELEIIMVDLDRANMKLAQVQRENEVLRSEISQYRDATSDPGWEDPQTLAARLRSVEEHYAGVVDAYEQLKQELKTKEIEATQRVDELERELALKTLQVAEFETKVAECEDYEEIKRELDVIKSIEFGGIDQDQTATEVDKSVSPPAYSPASTPNPGSKSSLEQLLLLKNKSLQSALTELKVSLETTQNELAACQQGLQAAQQRSEERRQLVLRLEDDLAKLQMERQQKDALDPLEALVSPAGPTLHGENASIIPILTGQRDRYRQRNMELEEQIYQMSTTISELRNDLQRAKDDNVKLYEQLRYAQSFGSQSDSVTRRSQYPPSVTRRSSMDTSIAMPYQSLYESSLDPFSTFKQSESNRRIKTLNPVDRLAYMFARVISVSKVFRWGFVAYLVVLHGLIWWVVGGVGGVYGGGRSGELVKVPPGGGN
ncbi:CASP C terminal-domain-containing protein [Gaertneriomyces semiglobifer]|nr:CASP C terminal-domain-containing protein [Gaertneriomyces semiglobifer]